MGPPSEKGGIRLIVERIRSHVIASMGPPSEKGGIPSRQYPHEAFSRRFNGAALREGRNLG